MLLTGALGTLGRAQARRFAGEGASLLLLDRPGVAAGPSLAQEISALGATALYVGQDLNDLEASAATARRLSDERDGIDILINNAALIVNRLFEDFSIAEYEDRVRVTSSAAFTPARALAPA